MSLITFKSIVAVAIVATILSHRRCMKFYTKAEGLGMLVSPWMGGILNEGMTTRAARWSWVRPVAELELKDWRRLETRLERLLELFSSSEELRLIIDPV